MGLLFLRGFSGVWSLGFIFLSLIFILSFISCLFCFLFLICLFLISCVLSFIFCEMHIRE
ncbi:hypothetical protein [Helicobacter pylori]|uniref:hypothetical protein n=1 Tax=Helicobacter pylori TaxID=210 RepID=UPI0009894A3C|nr:hypothetical protein [Helicobacter pylori]OOC29189.1 hypothetical protein BZK22_07590 [Helicobacter pylori]